MGPSSQLCPLAEKAPAHNCISTWAQCVEWGQGGHSWIWELPSTSYVFLVPQRDPFSAFCQVDAGHGQGTMDCSSLQQFITFAQLFQASAGQLFLSGLTPIPDPTAARGDSAVSHQWKTYPQKCWHPWFATMFFSFSPFETENSIKQVTCRIIHAKCLQSS